jgi:hypothetical protein
METSYRRKLKHKDSSWNGNLEIRPPDNNRKKKQNLHLNSLIDVNSDDTLHSRFLILDPVYMRNQWKMSQWLYLVFNFRLNPFRTYRLQTPQAQFCCSGYWRQSKTRRENELRNNKKGKGIRIKWSRKRRRRRESNGRWIKDKDEERSFR